MLIALCNKENNHSTSSTSKVEKHRDKSFVRCTTVITMTSAMSIRSESKQSSGTKNQSEETDTQTEWGWDAVRNWWNPSSQDACGKAERDLIAAFVDPELYEHEQRQVVIDYDPEPLSVKQKRLTRSRTSWLNNIPLFSGVSGGHSRSKSGPLPHIDSNETHPISSNLQKSKTERSADTLNSGLISKPKHKNGDHDDDDDDDKKLCIHTLTIRVKKDKLPEFIKRLQNKNDSKDSDSKEDPKDDGDDALKKTESTLSDLDTELKTDGAQIDGKSTRYYERTKAQHCTSTLSQLKMEIDELTENINDGQSLSMQSMNPIVISHGYGCAGGIIIPSIPFIFESLLSGRTVDESPVIHVFDWLGNGMSSRPEFQCETTDEAEDWFVESLEAWRKSMGIEKMILSAHSLGGYCSCVYTMRYPQHVDHLICVSPVGVPQRPSSSNSKLSWGVKALMNVGSKLWSSGVTPHDLIRFVGPKGKGMVQKMVQKRLFRLDDNHPLKALLAEYLYHVVAQTGSGEYACNLILQPGAWANKPLVQRIGYLKRFQNAVTGYGDEDNEQKSENSDIGKDDEDENEDEEERKGDEQSEIDADAVLNDNLKIDFIYGETDWMTSAHACKLKRENAIKCDVFINENCGHQLILENYQGFGQMLGSIINKGLITSMAK